MDYPVVNYVKKFKQGCSNISMFKGWNNIFYPYNNYVEAQYLFQTKYMVIIPIYILITYAVCYVVVLFVKLIYTICIMK